MLFWDQVKNLHKLCLIQLGEEILEGLKNELFDLTDVVCTAKIHCETRFKEGATEVFMDGIGWNWQEKLELLKEEVGLVGDQCRKDETKKMVNLIEVCRYMVDRTWERELIGCFTI